MKIVCISDTHGLHQALELPSADCIIHAGDVSRRGLKYEIQDFLEWFDGLAYTYKIFIAGNHDFYFEKYPEDARAMVPDKIIYLNDESVMIEGVKIWGSPVSPWFYDWAFNRQRGSDIDRHWQLITEDSDIVITHGPAFGKVDKTTRGYAVGCEDLLIKLQHIKPKYHICGHIHEAYGMLQTEHTTFINASVLDFDYNLVNDPIEISI